MFSRSGSTSNGDFDGRSKGAVLWVVRNGHVLASCIQARELIGRLFPAKIGKAWPGAVILYGWLPVIGVGTSHHLVAIHLDGGLKAIKIASLSGLKISFPSLRTKVMIIVPEEIVERYNLLEGDQFELKP